MPSAPIDPADHLRLLREQLILAQVRVMEIEDARDATQAKLSELERLLSAAQTLADAKLDEAAHLARTLESLQKEFEHLRHVQHVTNQALEDARSELGQTRAELDRESAARLASEGAVAATSAELARCKQALRELDQQAKAHAERIAQLDAELRAFKASRSWRWTAWLRSVERTLGLK